MLPSPSVYLEEPDVVDSSQQRDRYSDDPVGQQEDQLHDEEIIPV
jgi:hypothetical protein